MNIVIMITLKMITIILTIIIWVKVKATPNMPLGTQRGKRGIALPKPGLNATWLNISGGSHRKKLSVLKTLSYFILIAFYSEGSSSIPIFATDVKIKK